MPATLNPLVSLLLRGLTDEDAPYGTPLAPEELDQFEGEAPSWLLEKERTSNARIGQAESDAARNRMAYSGSPAAGVSREAVASAVANLAAQRRQATDPQSARWRQYLSARSAPVPASTEGPSQEDEERQAMLAALIPDEIADRYSKPRRNAGGSGIYVNAGGTGEQPEARANRQALQAQARGESRSKSALLAARRGVLKPSAAQALQAEGVLPGAPAASGAGGSAVAAFQQAFQGGQLSDLSQGQLADLYLKAHAADRQERLATAAQDLEREKLGQTASLAREQMGMSAQQAKMEAALRELLASRADATSRYGIDKQAETAGVGPKMQSAAAQAGLGQQLVEKGMASDLQEGMALAGSMLGGQPIARQSSGATRQLKSLAPGAKPESVLSILSQAGEFGPEEMVAVQAELARMGLTPDVFDTLAESSAKPPLWARLIGTEWFTPGVGEMWEGYDAAEKRKKKHEIAKRFGSRR